MVGRDGRIAYKLVGPITAGRTWSAVLKPAIEKALARARSELRPQSIGQPGGAISWGAPRRIGNIELTLISPST